MALRTALFAGLALLGVLLGGCEKHEGGEREGKVCTVLMDDSWYFARVLVTGVVVDSLSRTPLEGVAVFGDTLLLGYTDDEGRYMFANASGPPRYQALRFRASGYVERQLGIPRDVAYEPGFVIRGNCTMRRLGAR